MPGRKGKRRQEHWANDLTVYDYANTTRPQGSARLKKGVANSGIREAKVVSVSDATDEKLMADLSWFEKDLDDFELQLPDDVEEDEGQGENNQDAAAAAPQHRKGRRYRSNCQEAKSGRVYPADLWYILSQYIPPDAIRNFAMLCKDAYMTTTKIAFWRNLYDAYYSKDKELPEDLKPQAMERTHGLRARCIRAMFYLAPIMVEHVRPRGPLDTDPHTLVGHRCLLVWHQPAQGKWLFCFKLQKLSLRQQLSSMRPPKPEDLRTGYNNLFYNPEEGCCVLQVTTTHFASTSPSVMGQLLSGVHLSLNHNFRHQRMRLSFDSNRISETSGSSGHALECVLDPVIAIRIFHWWDPSYPFPT